MAKRINLPKELTEAQWNINIAETELSRVQGHESWEDMYEIINNTLDDI